MPKNLISNHFDKAGIYVEGERSVFPFKKPVTASFCSGMLVPLGDPIPVFPGTKLDLVIDAAIRSNTMVIPPLDGMYIDFFSVWVPHRIVWSHMPQFLGEPESVAWTQNNTYVYPYVEFHTLNNGWAGIVSYCTDLSVTKGNFSLVNHYGLLRDSVSSGNSLYSMHINILALRGYYSLWNYLFRDENYQRPVLFSKGDIGTTGEFGYIIRSYQVGVNSSNNPVTLHGSFNVALGTGLYPDKAVLMPVNKLHDAFTSLLPQAQFGNEVTLPLGTTAPVYINGDGHIGVKDDPNSEDWTNYTTLYTKVAMTSSGSYSDVQVERSGGSGSIAANSALTFVGSGYADLANATAASLNQFRYSVMYQRYLEALARGGRRMPEYMHTIYGVKNTNAKCDYPELIARSRYVLGVNQVVATADGSGSGWTSHLGDTGAYSLTALRNIPVCERDFTEFGYLHICYCVRADNRYSAMIQEHFLRSDILSEYNPFFDHIGDVTVPSLMVNMYANASTNFGFQEAWWSERTQLAMSTGALNKIDGSLKYWILGENLGTTSTCSPGYLTFDPAVLDDIFVSKYYAYPQFIIDAVIKGKKFARMSQHSIPGIVGRI